MATCYRHPNRETGVSCSNCGKPICPDCMTPTPVGMRCPDCARRRTTPVRAARTMAVDPIATYVLIAINVLVYVGTTASGSSIAGSGSGAGKYFMDFGLDGPDVANGDWWRLLTSGFLHYNILHIGLNMYCLWWMGRVLEPSIGHVRFVALYFASLLAGALGALLLSPNSLTAGASGAIFGLFGAAFVLTKMRGGSVMASGIGATILLNLVISVVWSSSISIGGHLGGLVGGGLAALAIEYLSRYRRGRGELVAVAVCVVVGAISVIASLAVA